MNEQQWYVRSKGVGGKYVAEWHHVPTGRKFYTQAKAEAFDECYRAKQAK